jgi:hypothetical protein
MLMLMSIQLLKGENEYEPVHTHLSIIFVYVTIVYSKFLSENVYDYKY